MRLIPGKTKVKIELFRHITLSDVIVGLIGLVAVTLCTVSSLPGRWIIALIVAALFGLMLVRLDDDPMYVFVWHMLRYNAYPKRLYRVYTDQALESQANGNRTEAINNFFANDGTQGAENTENSETSEGSVTAKEKKRQLKETIKKENKILKDKNATQEEKDAVWAARAERTAQKKLQKREGKEDHASFEEMSDFIPYTGIKDGYIEYAGKYYGAVIEIDPVEFRFFSKYRRNNSIENCFGSILRGLTGDYGANIVKIQRPIVYDKYLDAEYDKLDALRLSYESGMFTEQEFQARVEIQYDRIEAVRRLCYEDKVIESFYYLVLYESDKGRLDVSVRRAISSLQQGELTVRRLGTRDLALFLKYSNTLDFDEKQLGRIKEEDWVNWAMPESVKFSMRRTVINGMITHNMRVVNYPSVVGDSWLAGVMSYPATKVVVKATPMDKGKAIRAIDRSLTELRGQYMATTVDSKMLELQQHIDTLSTLLVMLQQDNEALLSVNVYVTAYDAALTNADPMLGKEFETRVPYVSDMKKSVKRSWSEAGIRLGNMDFMQMQSFIGSQISAYDPMIKDSRGIPSNTIAGMFPWIFAHISDQGGIQLGSSDGIPVFIDFFRRDSERVNSNMVIVGKSGSGKSYATKSLLTNLASEDAKIFILDPENEYSELAHTLHGKVINVGNAKYGRLNPFHIITALDDDEAGTEGGGPGGSFATHLQFLEEFFKQILPDIDKDALEYLNSLVERVYLNFGITPETDLSGFKAEDYPIFDDLYDVILAEFERTNNEYLRQLLRSLVNYIAKFSTGGRNSNIWNGPSTITTDENFSVFNFQSMLANRNTTIANAQMLLVLKYIDNEIIKNRDYNTKYGLKRKVVVVIDEAHVFIDTKFPVALDFMFQLAKRIRKYNGMQIVITQNIKDFVGSEEIARKSTAIINACQYSFVFGLAPNDMSDLCKLYEKAGGINEREQEDIINAKRGQAFTIMSPTSRSSFMIEVPDSFVDMFENKFFISNYFAGDSGQESWNNFVAESREVHDRNYEERKKLEAERVVKEERKVNSTLTFSEISEDELQKEEAEERASEKLDASSRPSAVEKFMAAEEAVDRKEYEMAVGRFGGINLSMADEDDISRFSDDDSDETDEYGLDEETTVAESESAGYSDYDEYRDDYSEDFGSDAEDGFEDDFEDDVELSYADDNKKSRAFGDSPLAEKISKITAKNTPVSPRGTSASAVNQRNVPRVAEPATQQYIEETLTRFKDAMREEMEKELVEKIKWISLGAGLGAASTQAAGTVAAQMAAAPATSVTPAASVAEAAPAAPSRAVASSEMMDNEFEDEEDTRLSDIDFDDDFEEEEGYSDDSTSDEDYSDGFEDDFEEEEDESLSFDLDEDEDEDDFSSDEDEFSEEDDDDDDEYASEGDTVSFDFGDDISDDEEEDEFDFDDEDEMYDEDEGEDYEPAPFLFAELLAEAAEEYANMNLDERMDEMGEDVIEITVEELAQYIKDQRKKKA